MCSSSVHYWRLDKSNFSCLSLTFVAVTCLLASYLGLCQKSTVLTPVSMTNFFSWGKHLIKGTTDSMPERCSPARFSVLENATTVCVLLIVTCILKTPVTGSDVSLDYFSVRRIKFFARHNHWHDQHVRRTKFDSAIFFGVTDSLSISWSPLLKASRTSLILSHRSLRFCFDSCRTSLLCESADVTRTLASTFESISLICKDIFFSRASVSICL